jgi:ribosome-binding factor A
MSIRNEKVASVIKRVLTISISKLAAEKGLGLASVSIIKLSRDLSVANVFINLFVPGSKNDGSIEKFLELLNHNKGRLRSIVAKKVNLRSTPELRFFYDDTLDQMQAVDKLLDNIKINFPYKEDYGDEGAYKF